MSKQDLSKKDEQEKPIERVKLIKIIQGQTFYHTEGKAELDICAMTPAEFDAWACSFVDAIVNVDRSVWDAFARWRFINTLIGERILTMDGQPDGTIVLHETEVKSSATELQTEVFSSGGISDETASQAS